MNIKSEDFSLKHTLECGQFFRYSETSEGYIVQVRDRAFKIVQNGDMLSIEGNVDKGFISNLFRLDEPYQKIEEALSDDKYTKTALAKFRGLRLMRQDPWECSNSYICSAASNIPKIKMNVELLSQCFGRPFTVAGSKYHAFPEPGTINCNDTARSCKVGFRAPYLCSFTANDKELNNLRALPYNEAKSILTQYPGIGSKIADCILLFSLGFDEAFPVDTWVRKIIRKLYLGPTASDKEILSYAKKFGKYAGYAQQYLYADRV